MYTRRACFIVTVFLTSPPSPDLCLSASQLEAPAAPSPCAFPVGKVILWKVIPLLREHKVDMQEREKKRVQNWRAPGRSTKSSRPPEWGLPAGEGGPGYGHAWDQWFPVAQRVSPGEKWMKRILWVPRPPLTHSPSPLPPHLSTSFPTSYPQPSHLQPTPHSLPLWTPPSPTWPLIPRRESSGVSTCQFKRKLLERESPTKMSHRAHGVSKSPGPHCTAPAAQMESRVPMAAVATRGKHGGLHAVPGCPGGGAEEPVQSPQSSSCLMGTRDPGGLVSCGGAAQA